MMKKILGVIAIVFVTAAFAVPASDPFATSVLRNLLLRIKEYPQEKVYLQIDREHYAAGEKVWFRAFLSDAVTHNPSAHSRYVYVELVDRKNKVEQRVKISGVDSVYAGYMPLSKKLQQGEYFLRAYSYWMQNAGEDFIFKKKIRIVNLEDTKVRTDMRYVKGKEGDVVEIVFTDLGKNVYEKVLVDYTIDDKSRVATTDKNGAIQLKSVELEKSRNVFVRFRNASPFEFERELYVPEKSGDFDIQFFPEGGELVAGATQTVAFKAIGTDGFGKDVEGILYNERDEFVTVIKSIHKGMGGFDFRPETGHSYYALVKSADSVQKRVDLPLPKSDGVALKVWMKDSTLNYSVLIGDSTRISDSLYLGVLSRGIPLICTPMSECVGKLPLNTLPEGIIHFVLMNSKYEIYSQRLCFVRKKERPELSVEGDKKSYTIREPVRVSVNVSGKPGQELSGSFSVAVTDDVQCERDSMAESHILSYFLLESDLKGYIEEPAFYFREVNRSTDRLLDLLMLTQGWTRFDLPMAIRGEIPESAYYLEKGQAMSGKVKNLWGKDALNASLVIFSTSGIIETATADSSGYFTVDGIAFPEKTEFVVQAKSKKGRRTVELIVESDSFLKPLIHFPYSLKTIEREDSFYKKFVKDYYYDNEMKEYVLDEVTVKRKVKAKTYSLYDQLATYALDSAKLASMGDMDIFQVLESLPNIWVDDAEGKIFRGSRPLDLYINDRPEPFFYVRTLTSKDLLYISYLDPFAAQTAKMSMNGVMSNISDSYGALVFSTKPDFVLNRNSVRRLNLSITSLLGYQKKAEFYVPKYDVDSVRQALAKDERPTIYWNPDVRTDQSGKAEFSFYTSDSYGPYTLIIEGILNDGTVCRKERKIALKSR